MRRDEIVRVPTLGQLAPQLEPHGFFRIHDRWVVNLRRVRLVRPRQQGADWEVVLESPVNRALPVARGRLAGLWATLSSGSNSGT
jgi:DNA-binding LytR/AlgR family response regulator